MIPDWAIIVGFSLLLVLIASLYVTILSVKSGLDHTDRWISDVSAKGSRAEMAYSALKEDVDKQSSSIAKLTPLMDYLGLKWVPASQSPGRIEKKK